MILTNVRPTLVDISPFFLPVPQHHDLDESFVQACHQTRRDLPYELTNALSQFAAGDSSGALLLRGLPVGVVPSTPATPSAPTAKDRTSECTLLTLATLLGEPVGYAPEHGGKIVQNIVPVQATAANTWVHVAATWRPQRGHALVLGHLCAFLARCRDHLSSASAPVPHSSRRVLSVGSGRAWRIRAGCADPGRNRRATHLYL